MNIRDLFSANAGNSQICRKRPDSGGFRQIRQMPETARFARNALQVPGKSGTGCPGINNKNNPPGYLVRKIPGRTRWQVYRVAAVERPWSWAFGGGYPIGPGATVAAVDYTLGDAYDRARILGIGLGVFDANT